MIEARGERQIVLRMVDGEDLVAGLLSVAAESAVIVGGGSLSGELTREARALGWPVLRTYGLTEAASQVATEALAEARRPEAEDRPLAPILPCWETRVDGESVLSIRGPALFTGYLEGGLESGWRLVDPRRDGWFRTSDRVELLGGEGAAPGIHRP